MSSSFQYNIVAAFRAVDAMQQTIVANAQGLLKPGYNRQKLHLGHNSGNVGEQGNDATQANGGRGPIAGGGDTLAISGHSINFEQGMIEPAFEPTNLAIRGDGFFMVAENGLPGARVYLTRAGDFRFDAEGRLVNGQGLFVVGGNGQVQIDDSNHIVGDVPFVRRQPDGTVALPDVSLARVGSPSQLGISGFGDTIYQPTRLAGPVRVFPNGRPEVGFVQSDSIEVPNRAGQASILATETTTATQTYKIFKDMLTEFNKTVDDAIQLVK